VAGARTPTLLAALHHSRTPPEQGARVQVQGDGWGSGEGSYEATVTESDDFTFSVRRKGQNSKWEETHVLRAHCTLLHNPAKRRRT